MIRSSSAPFSLADAADVDNYDKQNENEGWSKWLLRRSPTPNKTNILLDKVATFGEVAKVVTKVDIGVVREVDFKRKVDDAGDDANQEVKEVKAPAPALRAPRASRASRNPVCHSFTVGAAAPAALAETETNEEKPRRRPARTRTQPISHSFTAGAFDLNQLQNLDDFEFSISIPHRKVKREESRKSLGIEDNGGDIEEEEEGLGDGEESDDRSETSEVSEVTWMTFSAEIAQRELAKFRAFKRAQQGQEEQKKEEQPKNEVQEPQQPQQQQQQQQQPQEDKNGAKTLRKSFMAMMESNLNSNLSAKMEMLVEEEEENSEDEDDDDYHDYSSGALQVDFGPRPVVPIRQIVSKEKSSKSLKKEKSERNMNIEETSRNSRHSKYSRYSRYHDAKRRESEHSGDVLITDVDSIIDLKMQLAQQKSIIDELTHKYNRMAQEKENLEKKLELTSKFGGDSQSASIIDSLTKENASLRKRLRKLTAVLIDSDDEDEDDKQKQAAIAVQTQPQPVPVQKPVLVQPAQPTQPRRGSSLSLRSSTMSHQPNTQQVPTKQAHSRRPRHRPCLADELQRSCMSADAYGSHCTPQDLDNHFVSLGNARKDKEQQVPCGGNSTGKMSNGLDNSERSFFTALTLPISLSTGATTMNNGGRRGSAIISRRSSGIEETNEDSGPKNLRGFFQKQSSSRW